VLVVVVGGILTVFLSRRLSKPIHDLMDASRALEAGHFHFRFDERRNDEIGNLMTSFNRYAEGMERQHPDGIHRLSPLSLAECGARNHHQRKRQQLGGQCVEATVLFADIVGFTGMPKA